MTATPSAPAPASAPPAPSRREAPPRAPEAPLAALGRRLGDRGSALLALLAAAAAVAVMLRILPYQMDDAFITYRYAANAAAGHGVVYNPGGPAVEGFSSPLWLAALTAVAATAGPAALPFAAGALGLLAWVAALLLLARAAAPERGAALVGVALFALLPPAVFYAVTGLETVLFAALVIAYAASAAGALPRRLGVVAGALAVWVRPEGAWLPVMHAALLLGSGRARELVSARTRALVASVALGGALLLGVRWGLFEAWLPNTYWAKEARPGVGWLYLKLLFAQPWCALAAVAGGLGAAAGGARERGYAAAGASWLGAVVVMGGDWMPAGRFLLPALALFALAAGGLARAGAPAPGPRGRWWAVAGAPVWAAALAAAVAGGVRLGTQHRAGFDGIRHEARVLADWVAASGARSVAAVDVGELGWRTGIDVVDLAGLTDPRIARAPGPYLDKQFDLAYLLAERAPDVVIVRISVPPGRDAEGRLRPHPAWTPSPIETRLLQAPLLAERYVPLFALLPGAERHPLYGRMVYVRRDAAAVLRARPAADVVLVQPLRLAAQRAP